MLPSNSACSTTRATNCFRPTLAAASERSCGKWLDLNRDFVVHGRKTLQPRALLALQCHGKLCVRPAAFETKTMTVFDHKHIGKSIASIVGEGLRLMTTREGGIGWAHPRAFLGDEAFLFAGCSIPASHSAEKIAEIRLSDARIYVR
jgi:hypothetical protein